MKFFYKLTALAVLASAVLPATRGLAQGKVYIDEGWESQTIFSDVWDPNNIDGDLGRLSSSSAWLGWVYDPNGVYLGESIPETITGLRKLQSKPFTVTEEGGLYFSMDLWYFCGVEDSLRQFGVRIAEQGESLQWDTIFLFRKAGEKLPKTSSYGITGQVDTALGDKYNGKEIVFQIFFYNSMLDNSAFLMLFDNVFLRSYGANPQINTEFLSFPYLYGDEYNLRINCRNVSRQEITSVEFGYAVSDVEKTVEHTFTYALPGLGGEREFVVPLNMEGCEFNQTYTLSLWSKKINGAEAVYGDTVYFEFEYLNEELMAPQFVPLMECFTSSTCTPCKTMNTYLNPVLEELKNAGKMNVIKYQMNFPGVGDKYYIQMPNGYRGDYYGINSIPSPIFNAESNMLYWEGETYQDLMTQLREKTEIRSSYKAVMNIDITKAVIDAATMKLQLEFEVSSATETSAKVHAVVVEGTTTGNKGGNGEKEFHWVTMKAVITSGIANPGSTKNFTVGEPQTLSYTADMSSTHVEDVDDLQVVCFVQNHESGYIYQSAGIDVFAEGVANEKLCVLPEVRVYPNPASETATVSNLENALVQIIDLNGRTVYKAEGVSGNLNVRVSGLRAGTYLVNVSQNGRAATRKLVIVK